MSPTDAAQVSDAPPPYATVVFDCDSTLSRIEGIEELFEPGQDAEVRELTRRAMEGELALEEVYARRLELVRPDRATLARIAARYARNALPNAAELVAALRACGKRVLVVSGGLRPAVEPFARGLGIDEVHAVDVHFDASGAYDDFDRASPLARSGGKLELLSALAAEPGAAPLVLVGDGATDLEAAPVLARFVAFGGVVRRDAVFAAAHARCDSADLFDLLPLLLTPDERATLRRSPRFASLP